MPSTIYGFPASEPNIPKWTGTWYKCGQSWILGTTFMGSFTLNCDRLTDIAATHITSTTSLAVEQEVLAPIYRLIFWLMSKRAFLLLWNWTVKVIILVNFSSDLKLFHGWYLRCSVWLSIQNVQMTSSGVVSGGHLFTFCCHTKLI